MWSGERQTFHGNGAISHCASFSVQLIPRFTYLSFKSGRSGIQHVPLNTPRHTKTLHTHSHTHSAPPHTNSLKVKKTPHSRLLSLELCLSLAPIIKCMWVKKKQTWLSIMINCVTLIKVLLKARVAVNMLYIHQNTWTPRDIDTELHHQGFGRFFIQRKIRDFYNNTKYKHLLLLKAVILSKMLNINKAVLPQNSARKCPLCIHATQSLCVSLKLLLYCHCYTQHQSDHDDRSCTSPSFNPEPVSWSFTEPNVTDSGKLASWSWLSGCVFPSILDQNNNWRRFL